MQRIFANIWVQKEYNKIGLQQNICYNIYRGLVYWAKRIFLIQWWRERQRYSWQGNFLITEYIIKNDYQLRGGEGDIWSNKGYLLITGGWYMGYNRGGLAWGQLTNYAFVAQCSLHADYVGDHDDHNDEEKVNTGDYCQLCPKHTSCLSILYPTH